MNRKQAAAARARREQRQDMHEFGIKPGVAQALGFRDAALAPGEHDMNACDVMGCPSCLELANAKRTA